MRDGADRECLDTALRLAAGGLPVLPVKMTMTGYKESGAPAVKKAPMLAVDAAGQGGSKLATTDAAVIRGWFDKWPVTAIGVACAGAGLAMLDLDLTAGQSAEELLARLEDLLGPMPPTVRVRTGSGGLHFWFLDPQGAVQQKADWLKDLDPPLRGVDTRSAAGTGFIVVPPSLYPVSEGQWTRYAWEGAGPKGAKIADADWLLRLCALRKGRAPQRPLAAGPAGAEAAAEPLAGWDGVLRPAPFGLREALTAITPESNDDFFRVGVALYKVQGGEELFVEWCAQAAEQKPHRCTPETARADFRSFDARARKAPAEGEAVSTAESLIRQAQRLWAAVLATEGAAGGAASVAEAGAKLAAKAAAEAAEAAAVTAALEPQAPWAAGAEPVIQHKPVLVWRDKAVGGAAPEEVPLIHLGIVAMLAGAGAGGKTHLAARLAVTVAAGGEWLRLPEDSSATGRRFTQGWTVREEASGGVLWVAAEEDRDEVNRRLWQAVCTDAAGGEHREKERRRDLVAARVRVVALADSDAEGETLVRVVQRREQATGDSWADVRVQQLFHRIERQLKEPLPGAPWRLVILDPLTELLAGEENDNVSMRAAMRRGVHALRKLGVTVLLVHHTKKQSGESKGQDRVRGASALVNSARWLCVLDKPASAGAGFAQLEVAKHTHTGPVPPLWHKWTGAAGGGWLRPLQKGETPTEAAKPEKAPQSAADAALGEF